MRLFAKLGAAQLVLVASILPASASPMLPAATWQDSEVYIESYTSFDRHYYAGGDVAYGDGGASVSAQSSVGPYYSPSLSDRATGNYSGGTAYTAKAHLTYYYYLEISGPDSTGLSLNTSASGSVAGNSGAVASMTLSICNSPTSGPLDCRQPLYSAGTTITAHGPETTEALNGHVISSAPGSSFDVSRTLDNLRANVPYQVKMYAFASSYFDSGLVTASVDPTFSLDQSLIDQGYSLAFSPGVGNAPVGAALPAPASLPLFASGLVGLGAFGAWRRRKKRAA